ncbi:SSI family serine proteinase inhibitor [Streptomyces sp. NPDC052020]|uniref:SSI family serine proteinase inhibitor n=1 Tax=Streptomyces sp. NPDC052020 TaxID=3155677 RepID=UPI003424594D
MSQVISQFARRAGRQAPPRPQTRRPRPVLRRLLVTAASSLTAAASLAAGPSTAYASPVTAAPAATQVTRPVAHHSGDHLTVTVRNAGRGRDGTFQLSCHPGGGSHPDPEGACAAVERNTRWGQDAFAPAGRGGVCTMQYGGPATARVTGVWAGRPVDARYDRRDGCAIARWDRMVPLLPDLGAPASP